MIRLFDWRDISVVRQLSAEGICLDSITRLTRDSHPLQNALLAYLMPGAGAPTLVWREGQQVGFGQLRHRPGEEQARALFIAPAWTPANRAGRPIYVCVRRYQDWLQEILQASRLEGLGSQAVMVKRLAVRVSEPVLKPLPALEGNATTPMAGARLKIHEN